MSAFIFATPRLCLALRVGRPIMCSLDLRGGAPLCSSFLREVLHEAQGGAIQTPKHRPELIMAMTRW